MPNDVTTSALILQFEAQVALPLLVGMVGIALAWIKKRLNLQAESTGAQLESVANANIQQAVTNFASAVASGVASGQITPQNATKALETYLKTEVAGSMERLKPSTQALQTMLLGKLASAAGVEAVEPLAHLPGLAAAAGAEAPR